tara:strand:- start:152 stop:448 length:297 start_codon:yes stop_codon:yes gene_type:complete
MKRQNINKKNVLKEIYSDLGIPIAFSRKLIDSILEIIVEDLNKNNKVKISGFGTFKIINKKSREGRNPKSKELFLIKPRKVVSFYPSKEVRKKINEKP